jgi:hypothetical protein
MTETQQRPVIGVHRHTGVQIKSAPARRLDGRGVLNRQHMARSAARPQALRRARSHLIRAHVRVAQETGQANLSRPVSAQPPHPYPFTAGRNQTVVQKHPPHMGGFQSSSIIWALCMLLGVWIRSVSPSLPCGPDDRITSHPVELVGSDHNPSCSRASGSGWRDHPFSRRVSARGLIRGRRPPGSGEAVAFSFRWSGVESSGHAALNTAPSGTTPWVT